MNRLLPYPLLAIGLLLLWLTLHQTLALGQVLLGALIAVAASWAMAALQPQQPRIGRPGAALRLAGTVLHDIVRSNIAVLKIILRVGGRIPTSDFVSIPLTLSSPYGLAALACIITATPGTVWVNFDPRTGILLIHVLDLVDERIWIDTITNRYERRLLEIFP